MGEVQKAIDWINDYSLKKESELFKSFERQNEIKQIEEKYQVQSVMAESVKPKEVIIPPKIVEAPSVKLRADDKNLSMVYSWGNGLQG